MGALWAAKVERMNGAICQGVGPGLRHSYSAKSTDDGPSLAVYRLGSMTIITDTRTLTRLCADLGHADYITVDTEFLRDSTYYSKLCLIQVAGPNGAWIIDALADGLELAPFFELLVAPRTLKVFHAARQDIEIFFHLMDRIPEPVFDSQVAAMVCGFGDAVSYEKLALRLTGARLDKSSRFTDWSRRPLSKRQIDYALGDVTHLRGVYETLADQLDASDRMHWLDEEMAILMAPETYANDAESAWRRLKSRSNDRRYLAVLKEVAAWRERQAQARDVPRNRVLRDEAVLKLAAQAPTSVDDLANMRALPGGFARRREAAELLAAVRHGLETPPEFQPKPESRPGNHQDRIAVVELLKVLLKAKCEEHGVAQKLVATSADLQRIAVEDAPDVPAVKGWRHDLFGADALALKRGEVALAAKGRRIRMVQLRNAD